MLAFLKPLDTGGKFRDLGVPLRRPPTFAADGKASDLSFWSIRAGCAYWSGQHVLSAMDPEDPMCFDGVEYSFCGNWGFESAGKPKPFAKDRLDAYQQLAERGYAVKQGAHVQSHAGGGHVAPLSLLPAEVQKDPDLYLIDAKGERTGVPNIWHPAVRELYAKNLKAIGRQIREQLPKSLLYEPMTAEPGRLAVIRTFGDTTQAPSPPSGPT